MTGYERAKYEKVRAETKEEDRRNLIDLCRKNGFSDEKINEELTRYGYKPLD